MADNNKITFMVVLACICLFIILMPIIGGVWYGVARVDEKHFKKSECLIINYTISIRIDKFSRENLRPLIVIYNTTEHAQREAFIPYDVVSDSYADTVSAAQKHPVRFELSRINNNSVESID